MNFIEICIEHHAGRILPQQKMGRTSKPITAKTSFAVAHVLVVPLLSFQRFLKLIILV